MGAERRSDRHCGSGKKRGRHLDRVRSELCREIRRRTHSQARDGVVGVANDLEVRLPQTDERPDPEIAREVVANLKIWLPSSWEHIKAVVKNGWVTLEGEVEWNYQRDYAERAVRWIKGVKGVSNLIRLQPRLEPKPVEIKQKIEEAFRRSARVDANRITVETHG